MSESLVELMAGLTRPGWRWDFWAHALVHDELQILLRPDQLRGLDVHDEPRLHAVLLDHETRARSRRGPR